MPATVVLAGVVPSTATEPDIGYGSREGMTLTLLSREGIGTSHARIHVRHTRQDAENLCNGYAQDPTEKCVRGVLADTKIDTYVEANCRKGTWNDANSDHYRLFGRNKDKDALAAYNVRNLDTGDTLDGSGASNYYLAMTTLKALCADLIE